MHDHLKTVVITGGTQGIGAAIADYFKTHGYKVVVLARHGKGDHFVKADVTKRVQLRTAMQKIIKQNGSIDVVINCAGISGWRPLAEIDERFVDEMMDVNLKGVLFTIQAALKFLKSGAAIINVASLAGKRGSVNNSVYCAAKFGVVGVTQALAKELGPKGIRVNAVCPVYVATQGVIKALKDKNSPAQGKNITTFLKNFSSSQTALKRLPTALEVAQVCLFLASDEASAITGQSLNVDCGVLLQ